MRRSHNIAQAKIPDYDTYPRTVSYSNLTHFNRGSRAGCVDESEDFQAPRLVQSFKRSSKDTSCDISENPVLIPNLLSHLS